MGHLALGQQRIDDLQSAASQPTRSRRLMPRVYARRASGAVQLRPKPGRRGRSGPAWRVRGALVGEIVAIGHQVDVRAITGHTSPRRSFVQLSR